MHTDIDTQPETSDEQRQPTRIDQLFGPRLYADELHRLRKAADLALDSIDHRFATCFGNEPPAYMVGAADTPDREAATLHGEVGRGHTITSTREPLPSWVHAMIERLTP